MSDEKYSRRHVLELAGKLTVGLGATVMAESLLLGCGGNQAPATLSSLVVSPASWSAKVGDTQQIHVTAKMSDGSSKDVTANASFSSANSSIASVDASGLATALATGSTSLTASYKNKTASVGVTVSAKTASGPNAVVTGSFSDGTPINVSVAPGTRVAIIDGDETHGSVWHTGDGAVLIENAYIRTTGDLTMTVTVSVGAQQLFSGKLTIWQRSRTRPFWYKQPKVLASADLSKFATLAGGATASMATSYAKADNSPMGIGLVKPGIGSTGEWPHLGQPFPEWDASYLTNPTADNLKVVRGMADASAPWPFHVIDIATQKPIDLTTYPKASLYFTYIGTKGNPFTPQQSQSPMRLSQANGHVTMYNVLACALFDTEYDRDALTHWGQYIGALWNNAGYRLPSGVVMAEHLEGARGMGRSLLLIAYASRYSDRTSQFTTWTKDFVAHVQSIAQSQTGIHVMQSADNLGYYNNTGFAPWQHHILVGALGMCIKLGYTSAQWCLDYFGKQVLDSLLNAPHEFATLYAVVVKDPSGNIATDWPAVLQLTKAADPKLAAALNYPENSLQLIQALTGNNSAYHAGDFSGYPWSATGYPAMMQGAVAMLAKYATDQSRAQQAWTKFQKYARMDYSTNPKYNVVG